MTNKQKYYVVWQGKSPGIYDNWQNCEAQVKGFNGAKYKSFKTLGEANDAFKNSYKDYFQYNKKYLSLELSLPPEVLKNSICVDAACSGNPGMMEYQGVETGTKKQIFHYGPIWGTNNLGEFLAIVFLLAILKKANDVTTRIYTDSAVAMKWVKIKQVKSKLIKNAKTKEVWALVEWAIAWLNDNMYTNKILKWETEKWGEIPADFGRK